jgi:hypothetical protein
MRTVVIGVVVGLVVSLCGVGAAHAQDLERIPDDIAKPVIESGVKNLENVKDAPIKVEPDVDKFIVIVGGEAGAGFIPHKGLSEESIKKSDKETAPLGILAMRGLTPAIDGKPVPKEKLRTVAFSVDGENIDVTVFFVGVKTENGTRQLLIYAKDKEPLLKVNLNDFETNGDRPVIIEGKGFANGAGTLNVNVLKKFQALVPLKQE